MQQEICVAKGWIPYSYLKFRLRLEKKLMGGWGVRKKCVLIYSPRVPQIHMSLRTYSVRRQCVECKVRCITKCMECGDRFMHLEECIKKNHRMV